MQSDRNIFDERFNKLSESIENADSIRTKLIEGVLELSELRRLHNSKQVILTQKEDELSKLMKSNQDLKLSLMKTLIEKEEVSSKKATLAIDIDELNDRLDCLDNEANGMLTDERVKVAIERFATTNQLAIMNKLEDARCKLIKYGYANPDRIE